MSTMDPNAPDPTQDTGTDPNTPWYQTGGTPGWMKAAMAGATALLSNPYPKGVPMNPGSAFLRGAAMGLMSLHQQGNEDMDRQLKAEQIAGQRESRMASADWRKAQAEAIRHKQQPVPNTFWNPPTPEADAAGPPAPGQTPGSVGGVQVAPAQGPSNPVLYGDLDEYVRQQTEKGKLDEKKANDAERNRIAAEKNKIQQDYNAAHAKHWANMDRLGLGRLGIAGATLQLNQKKFTATQRATLLRGAIDLRDQARKQLAINAGDPEATKDLNEAEQTIQAVSTQISGNIASGGNGGGGGGGKIDPSRFVRP